MNPLLRIILAHAVSTPRATALEDGERTLSYRALAQAVGAASARIGTDTAGPAALAMDNGPAWAIADLALLHAGRVCVPLPPFFSPQQRIHALKDAGVQWLITDSPQEHAALLAQWDIPTTRLPDIELGPWRAARYQLSNPTVCRLPAGTMKVTYTSGTTGAPKGVSLDLRAISSVAASLREAAEFTCRDRHLALLPLSTLLENIAGLYVPLSAGGCAVLPSLARVGSMTATGTVGDRPAAALAAERATTTIMVPQLLRDLCGALEAGAPHPALRFLAVGGASVSNQLLERATRLKLPVYEGYGLSECASVVALNTRHANRPGSVGRVLPHASVRIARDGEIFVSGATFLGYTGEGTRPETEYATGDVGHLDGDGYLYVTGRKKHVFITSHGRNVSPEWVETELTASDAVCQAWVYGEGQPWNCAVITPRAGETSAAVDAAVARANARLPAYARVRTWIEAAEPFTAANGLTTANGRLRRDVLYELYGERLAALYQEKSIEFS